MPRKILPIIMLLTTSVLILAACSTDSSSDDAADDNADDTAEVATPESNEEVSNDQEVATGMLMRTLR